MNTYFITAKAVRHGIGWTSTSAYITARNDAKAKEISEQGRRLMMEALDRYEKSVM